MQTSIPNLMPYFIEKILNIMLKDLLIYNPVLNLVPKHLINLEGSL